MSAGANFIASAFESGRKVLEILVYLGLNLRRDIKNFDFSKHHYF